MKRRTRNAPLRAPLVLFAVLALPLTCQSPSPPCEVGSAGDGVSPPNWMGIVVDPGVEPSDAGYTEYLEFRTLPEGRTGNAVVFRFSSQDLAETVLRNEARTWGVVVYFDDQGHVADAFGYRDESRDDQFWAMRASDFQEVQAVRPRTRDESPTALLCRALASTGIASEAEITGVARGRMKSIGAMRRVFHVRPLRH